MATSSPPRSNYFPFSSLEDASVDKPPRPRGSLGEPGNGGYSLRVTLKWTKEAYDQVQVSFYTLRRTKLSEAYHPSRTDCRPVSY